MKMGLQAVKPLETAPLDNLLFSSSDTL